MRTIIRSLCCTAVLAAGLHPAGARSDTLVANSAELSLDGATIQSATGGRIPLRGIVAIQADVEWVAAGAIVKSTCRITGGDAEGLGTTSIVGATQAHAMVAAPLPADVTLLCPATLLTPNDGTVQHVRVHAKATVFDDGRMTFALGDVTAE